MITKTAFIDGVLKYAGMEALPKMPNGMAKFLGYVGLGAVQKNPDVMLGPYLAMMERVGIIKDGNVDVATLECAMKAAFAQQSSIEIAGFKFSADDLPVLMKYLA